MSQKYQLTKLVFGSLLLLSTMLESKLLGQKVFQRLTEREYQQAFDELWPQGFRPTRIEVKVVNGVGYYSLAMEKPKTNIDCVAKHLLTDSDFQKRHDAHLNRGFKLFIHRSYQLNGRRRHVAVWVRPSLNRPLGSIWKAASEVPVSGRETPGMKSVDEMVTQFLVDNQIPGATIAISRDSNVVYSRGFGYWDLENQRTMKPDMLMRIASVSKPITAAAVMQLASRDELQLNKAVFSKLPTRASNSKKTIDPRLRQVTVEQLLRHRGGWDRKKSFDPMFRQIDIARSFGKRTPVTPNEIIQYMWTQPLDFPPGEKFVYSNFGYSILGRVVEQASGMLYEKYVSQEVLAPLGVRKMRIGKTKLSERATNEVKYYPRDGVVVPSIIESGDKDVPRQYGGWYLESLDAHGGWIASAEDLVKFASAFDRPDECLLMSSSYAKQMFIPKDVEQIELGKNGIKRYYSYGWQVVMYSDGRFNCYHTGQLDGTQALLVRRSDGLNWAVLFNTDKNPDGKYVATLIDPLVHRAVNSVKKWP